MIIAGIDYSMSCPAMFIGNSDEFSFKNGHSFFLTAKAKDVNTYQNIRGDLIKPWSTAQERYNHISEHFTKLCKDYNVEQIMIEGYSMGSRGKVFNIAENGGLLKHKLWKAGYIINEVPPTSLKKYATGKGNSGKDIMYNFFTKESGLNLENLLGKKCINNPISDIVDSYFIAKYLINVQV